MARYPKFFTAASLRNPIISVPDMITTSDVPDWATNQFLAPGAKPVSLFGDPLPSPAEHARMYAMSPIAHADKVDGAISILVGDADARVPMTQAKMLYHALKARQEGGTLQPVVLARSDGCVCPPFAAGPKVEMLVFPGGTHNLTGVEVERVSWERTMQWFMAHSA